MRRGGFNWSHLSFILPWPPSSLCPWLLWEWSGVGGQPCYYYFCYSCSYSSRSTKVPKKTDLKTEEEFEEINKSLQDNLREHIGSRIEVVRGEMKVVWLITSCLSSCS